MSLEDCDLACARAFCASYQGLVCISPVRCGFRGTVCPSITTSLRNFPRQMVGSERTVSVRLPSCVPFCYLLIIDSSPAVPQRDLSLASLQSPTTLPSQSPMLSVLEMLSRNSEAPATPKDAAAQEKTPESEPAATTPQLPSELVSRIAKLLFNSNWKRTLATISEGNKEFRSIALPLLLSEIKMDISAEHGTPRNKFYNLAINFDKRKNGLFVKKLVIKYTHECWRRVVEACGENLEELEVFDSDALASPLVRDLLAKRTSDRFRRFAIMIDRVGKVVPVLEFPAMSVLESALDPVELGRLVSHDSPGFDKVYEIRFLDFIKRSEDINWIQRPEIMQKIKVLRVRNDVLVKMKNKRFPALKELHVSWKDSATAPGPPEFMLIQKWKLDHVYLHDFGTLSITQFSPLLSQIKGLVIWKPLFRVPASMFPKLRTSLNTFDKIEIYVEAVAPEDKGELEIWKYDGRVEYHGP